MLPRAAAYCEPITGNNCCGYQQVLKTASLSTEVCFGAKELARDCKICKSTGNGCIQPQVVAEPEVVADFTSTTTFKFKLTNGGCSRL